MNDFSITKTAFSGYGLAGRKPMLWLVLAVMGIALSIGIAALAVIMAGPQLAELKGFGEAQKAVATGGTPPDPRAMLSPLGAVFQYAAVAGLLGLIATAINFGAANRAIVRPAASKFPYVGLLGDEFRLLVVMVAIGVMIAIPALILFVIGQIISVAVMIGTGGPGALQKMSQGERPPVAMLATTFSVYGLVVVLALMAGAKFALAAAQTIAERGIRIFGSWQLTSGRYWKVLGTLLLSFISLIPLACVVGAILYGVALATGADIKSLAQPDYSTMIAIFSPLQIARYVVGGAATALATLVVTSATANIYRAIVEGTEAGVYTADDDDEDWDDED
ncbi:MAG: hypothetical protein WCI21_00740 [Alphaproteobacteria bacterium]